MCPALQQRGSKEGRGSRRRQDRHGVVAVRNNGGACEWETSDVRADAASIPTAWEPNEPPRNPSNGFVVGTLDRPAAPSPLCIPSPAWAARHAWNWAFLGRCHGLVALPAQPAHATPPSLLSCSQPPSTCMAHQGRGPVFFPICLPRGLRPGMGR